MTLGPIIIFDKSTLQSLSVDEAVWLDTFYRANITPLFFVETLADLEKQVAKGRTPEQVVGNLAYKTPIRGALPNVYHGTLCLGELLGHAVEMIRFPVITGGQHVVTGDRRGVIFKQAPEIEALERWQSGEFLEVERLFARLWRRGLSGLNLHAIYEQFRPPKGMKLRDPASVKAAADRLLRRDGARYATLKLAMEFVGVPPDLRSSIIDRWRASGGPPLPEFAPYTAYVLTVDRFFNLALGSDLISRERPSNKIDIAYLYYLPFCMVFASNDNLHARCVPCFLGDDQMFLTGSELKADLAKLDAYYGQLPEEVREQGVMTFASAPPVEGDFLITRLWDQFLPRWRANRVRRHPRSKETDAKIVEHVMRMKDTAKPDPSGGTDVQSTDFVHLERRVPVRMGKWRLLPPGVEKAVEKGE